jgi:membrane protease YdiL (CAAX protease family)
LELPLRLATLFFVQDIDQSEYYSKLPVPIGSRPLENAPTPDDPPWNVLTAFAVWIVSVLFILIIPAIFLLPYLLSLNPPITDSEQIREFATTDPTSIFIQIAAIIPAHILTLVLTWLVVTRRRTFSFRKTLGWKSGEVKIWHYILILAVFFCIAAIVGHYYPEQENDLLRILRSSRNAVYIVAFMATFTAPIVEEVVYRGVLFSAFQRTLGVPVAFLVVTFLFAIVHVPQYYPSYSTIFLLVILSVTLTFLRVWSKNLLPCIILHTMFNGAQSILLVIQPWIERTNTPEQIGSIFALFK